MTENDEWIDQRVLFLAASVMVKGDGINKKEEELKSSSLLFRHLHSFIIIVQVNILKGARILL